MAHGMAGSASEPNLDSRRGSSGGGSSRRKNNLADIGASISLGAATTNLYDKMYKEGKFRESCPQVRPSGRSIVVPLADSSERDVQPDIYFPAPPTPVGERKYRSISHGPGEIHVHYGLKDQKLPGEDFRYGMRGVKGSSTEGAMKAGQLFGVAEYKNSVAERIYESTKREPLGKPYVRGHNLKMLPEGFGNPSGEPADAKMVIFPVDQKPNTREQQAQYRTSHNAFMPGERIDRRYSFPTETKGTNFRYGKPDDTQPEGAGSKAALATLSEDDLTYRRTKFVQKVNEDYRNVQHTKVGAKIHPKQGFEGPPLHHQHRYGVKSTSSDYTARSCIKGYYTLPEQLPDQDLGSCQKPGRRNVTTETRAFGCPSVRTDVPAPPPGKKSIADPCNYGDECGCAALLNPQRFDMKGVPDSEFLIRRPMEELRSICDNTSYNMGEDFDTIFEEAVELFDDGMPLVSLDAILYLHTQQIETQVAQRLTASSSAPQLVAGGRR